MRKSVWCGMMLMALGAAGLLLTTINTPGSQAAVKNTAAEKSDGTKPVESDMHEFMEYIYKPTYMRLRTAMAKKPRRTAWRGIKADSLILAEGGNLLLLRVPKENGTEWKKLSVENRGLGAKVYAAAKKRDYETARKHYEAMITNCNLCHKKFAGGEHQLKP